MGNIIKLNSKRVPVQILKAQEGEELGIENIKKVVSIVTIFFVDLVTVIKSKNYFDLLPLVFNLIRQGNVLAFAQQAWEEIKDTSLEESNDIHLHFASVLDLENDETEALIEQAFALVPKAYGIIQNSVDFVSEVRGLFSGKTIELNVDTSVLLAA